MAVEVSLPLFLVSAEVSDPSEDPDGFLFAGESSRLMISTPLACRDPEFEEDPEEEPEFEGVTLVIVISLLILGCLKKENKKKLIKIIYHRFKFHFSKKNVQV